MNHREDLQAKLIALPMAREDLNRRIRELQHDEIETIEQLVGVTSRISAKSLPGTDSPDLSGSIADILLELDRRRNHVYELLEKYLREDQEIRDLQEAVNQLPPSLRLVLRKKYFEMMTLKEIEEETGIERTTIHRRISSAMDSLCARISEKEEGK